MAAIETLTRIKRPSRRNGAEAEALAKLGRELQTQLAYLRQSAREIARIHADNLGHDLLELSDAAKKLAAGGGGKRALRTLKQLVAVTDRVTLKPVKGRRKDLARIEKAVARMDALIER
ncbi:MAG: hypothetical protein MUF78_05900 [Candidatus Edwardsbacteria bacterium]|jgi:hypothetical protein|nr:hypothetical protein [Candidatus Edwardsbacteria bacterium]